MRLHVKEFGPRDRTLLIVHGGPDWDHSYLVEPLDRLAGERRLLFPDLRGCGRSPWQIRSLPTRWWPISSS
ncbi:alpha/beta fold hydrolase [Nonomuraea dietziae]|uniref:alpha/beta fold hydrolase n=1 Tax=Nonomuraea dietziae TaxID=65515 RepID=UPI0033F957A4